MPSFFSELFGAKPEVPDLPSLSLGAEQQKALASNLAALPGAEQIAGKVDLFNREQIDKMMENIIPNYKAITGATSRNILSMSRGEIPADVAAAIARSDAGAALQGGFAGTGAGRNLVARDLGLTSLDLTNRGLASAESWMRTASSIYEPGMMNVQSMFVSPQQTAGFDVSERESQFQQEWMKNQIAAMPDPTTVGIYNFASSMLGGLLPSISKGGTVSSSGIGKAASSYLGSLGGTTGAAAVHDIGGEEAIGAASGAAGAAAGGL